MAIGIALIGSGIFAREEHLPAIKANPDITLKAVYSRSLKSAESLGTGVDLYSDDGEQGYADVLAREDIEAVVIALPILIQPTFIKQALAAGKHVLSEKPIAKDVDTAQDLLTWYKAQGYSQKLIWAVAENYRYVDKITRTAAEVKKLGSVKTFRVNVRAMVSVDSKYYKTSWRQTPEYDGGFVLDGGIHIIAALRLILGDKNPILPYSISAQSTLLQKHLAPIDTVDAVMKTVRGTTGVVSLSYGSPFRDFTFEFVCEGGTVVLQGDNVVVNGVAEEVPFRGRGVQDELGAFVDAVRRGEGVPRLLSVEEAIMDLGVMMEMFRCLDD